MKLFNYILFSAIAVCGCSKDLPKKNPITYGDSFVLAINSDKAAYAPGDNIQFTLNKPVNATLKIRYSHLNQVVGESTLSGQSWSWTAPSTDFTGYLVQLYDSNDSLWASTAVDVSSDWSRFPRYGFLSSYGQMTDAAMEKVIKNLALHHINGLQFYDWQYKHQTPLAGTPSAPLSEWTDIANRPTYLATVQGYISNAHKYGMKAMFYNLAFGALNDAASDGVLDQWYLYKDQNHTTKDVMDLDASMFKSNIYITNPGNTDWQNYLIGKNADVYKVFDFDGYHIDQLGDRGTLYDYSGNQVNLGATYHSFIEAMKNAASSKHLVMNAVNQYGQEGSIATAPVDFLYTEVWDPNNTYADLATIIQNNDNYGSGKKSVLAAYMDYDLANNTGTFNTPGVLLTDAVIFAFGGSHLELGEHMLCKEYFPNANLGMNGDLSVAMIRYYDFLVAYENLLRDGGSFNTPQVVCTNNAATLNNWPPVQGQVSVIGKTVGSAQVLHLVNFTNANSLDWRDTNGTQAAVQTINNITLSYTSSKAVTKIWYASPDSNMGQPQAIAFTQTGNQVQFTVPSLKYWDMITIE